MSSRPDTETSHAPQESAPRAEMETPVPARKKLMPMVWIPATLCLGLLIAAVYLGGRIVAAHSRETAHILVKPAAQVVVPVPAVPPAPVAPVAAPAPVDPKPETRVAQESKAEVPAADNEIPDITPKTGERYLQVGALDLEATPRWVEHLRQAKLEPHVAPGPTPDLLRILIGPFPDRDSLASKKNELDSAGIDNFVREY